MSAQNKQTPKSKKSASTESKENNIPTTKLSRRRRIEDINEARAMREELSEFMEM